MRILFVLSILFVCSACLSCKYNGENRLPIRLTFTDSDAIYVNSPQPTYGKRATFSSPEFPGGHEALDKFIQGNRDITTTVPKNCLSPGLDTVVNLFHVSVYVIINTEGDIHYYKYPVHGNPCGLQHYDEDVRNIIKIMPKWIPAYKIDTISGRKIPMEYTVPIAFTYPIEE